MFIISGLNVVVKAIISCRVQWNQSAAVCHSSCSTFPPWWTFYWIGKETLTEPSCTLLVLDTREIVYSYVTVSLCHGFILSWCHYTMVSLYHGFIIGVCHYVLVSLYHIVIIPWWWYIMMSLSHGVIISWYH